MHHEGTGALPIRIPGPEGSVQTGVLSVLAERRDETPAQHDTGFRYGTHARHAAFPLGSEVQDMTAASHDGILTGRIGPEPEPAAAAHIVRSSHSDNPRHDKQEAVMDTSIRPKIVVGVSGSRASAAALAWAAAEAQGRHAELLVVRAWQPEQLAPCAMQSGRRDRRQQQEAVTGDLAASLSVAFGADEQHRLTTRVLEGTAERVLADASTGADLLVLGSTSAPALADCAIGPVIRSCLGRAHCPVVVIGPEGRTAGSTAGLAGQSAGGRLAGAAGHQQSNGALAHHGASRRLVTTGALPVAGSAPRTGE
jgi:nucleotide-binding universal stress UspA family protein